MENNNNKGGFIGVVIMVFVIAFMLSMCTSGGESSKSGKKWSELSDVEKDNARWAYEAKKYIDSQK